MELTTWLSLAAICILGAITPGASLALVLKHTISGGRINGIAASIAHGIGVALYALLTVLGMALVIKQTPWLFGLIKYAGVAFLLWLAFKAFTSKTISIMQLKKSHQVSLFKSSRDGFLIAFLNPKLAIFFLALFSQFLDSTTDALQKMVMVITVGTIDALWYCIVAVLLSQSSILDKIGNNLHTIERVTGVVLIAIAARVLM